MKATIFSMLLLALSFGLQAQATTPTVFQNFGVRHQDSDGVVYFTVSKEANIRYYVIEGRKADDTFEIIGSFPSDGNTIMPRTYEFPISGFSYSGYRIRQVDLMGAIVYSPVLKSHNQTRPKNNMDGGVVGGNYLSKR